jgi:RimJ/RimL family protein N-acetyltransferase
MMRLLSLQAGYRTLKDEGFRFPFIITLKGSDQAIGMIDPRIEGTKAAIGYVLSRLHQRNGYMTEATRAIIQWAFQQPPIFRVYATTDVENIPSQRVLEKSGMEREGMLKKYIVHPNISSEPRDSYIYAIVK